MKSNFLKLRSIIAIVLIVVIGFSTITCGGVSGGGEKDGEKPGVYLMNISEISDWDYVAVSKDDGSSLYFNVDESTGSLTHLYIKPEKDSDDGVSYFFNENGLPNMAVHNGNVVYIGNYNGYTFDFALITPDGEIEYYRDVQTDVNFDASGEERSAQARYFWDLKGTETFWGKIGKSLEWEGLAWTAVQCGIAVAVPVFWVGCATGAISAASSIAVEWLTKDVDGPLNDVLQTGLSALGCTLGIAGIVTGGVSPSTPMELLDCASAVAGIGSLLFDKDKDALNADDYKKAAPDPYVAVTGVNLNQSHISMTAGENKRLTAAVLPSNASNKAVRWTTTNANVARVGEFGMVTAVAAGDARIDVTTVDGRRAASCYITVTGEATDPVEPTDPPSLTGIELVSIPAGTFTMGSPATEANRNDNETQHSVTLSSFKMSKYEVTQAQWAAVMGKTIVEQQALVTTLTTDYGRGDNYPVYFVSWYDALVFCNKLSMMEGLTPAYSISGSTDPAVWGTVPTIKDKTNAATWDAVVIVAGSTGYRLPTEAQWEYACRARTTTAYNTGAVISDDTGWYDGNSGRKTHEVGLKSANAWGLYDMHGNVSEWCWDWAEAGDYSSSSVTNPTGAVTGSYRIRRGMSYLNIGEDLRSACRESDLPSMRDLNIGFRLVRP
jgi:formylglycine-generating enzyme required for sulfatase activity